MTLKGHWKRKALDTYSRECGPRKAEIGTPERVKQDFKDAFDLIMLNGYRRGDFHAYVHFNDGTNYKVCARYHRNASVAAVELKRVAALVLPTDMNVTDPEGCEVAENICPTCNQALHDARDRLDLNEITDLDPRIIWRDIHSGLIGIAMGLNNLGSLP